MSLFFRRNKTYTKLHESGVGEPHITDAQIPSDGKNVSVVTLYDSFVIFKFVDDHYDIEQYTRDKVLMERSHVHISRIHDIGMYKHSEKEGYEMAIMLTSGEYLWYHGTYEATTKAFDFVKSFTIPKKVAEAVPKKVAEAVQKKVAEAVPKKVAEAVPKKTAELTPKTKTKKTKTKTQLVKEPTPVTPPYPSCVVKEATKPTPTQSMYPSLEQLQLDEKHLQIQKDTEALRREANRLMAERETRRRLIDEEASLKKSQRDKAFPQIPQYNPPVFPSIPTDAPPLREKETALIDFWQ